MLLTRSLSQKSVSTQISIVSSKGMLVKRESTSKEDMCNDESKLVTSFANEKESFTIYSLEVTGFSNGTKYLHSL